ncbi:M23 family metallopeptidase [Winogradskyella sp.]|uniref:M23 family metallopeptidase n=1 Tax=Winogradskyella sp. TaxID=1883156 RepID=UPI003F6ABE04
MQKATNASYNDVWAISNYVDHNPVAPDALSDYNCGPRTYDTTSGYNHQGLDIFSWPFTWHMMDNNYVEIISAAPGQIIAKNDGQFDRSCDFNSNFWNAVYIQHNDGSIAWYGHLKNGSLTSKNVGDMVSEGEFLGVMGSSGNSTGPHLHFEVWVDATYTQLVDPYIGTCNTMDSETWWQSQKPYVNPGINAALTHSDAPVFPNCPTQEITNISEQFDIDDTIYFGLYLRDQVMGESVNLKIIRPDNSIL